MKQYTSAMSSFAERMAEERIQAAIDSGAFDNLAGSGKPLPQTGTFTQERWLQQYLEREGLDGLATAPTVLGLRKEAQQFPDSLLHYPDEQSVREHLRDYNRRVKHNRLHPDPQLPRTIMAPLIDVEAMVQRWRERRMRSVQEDITQ